MPQPPYNRDERFLITGTSERRGFVKYETRVAGNAASLAQEEYSETVEAASPKAPLMRHL